MEDQQKRNKKLCPAHPQLVFESDIIFGLLYFETNLKPLLSNTEQLYSSKPVRGKAFWTPMNFYQSYDVSVEQKIDQSESITTQTEKRRIEETFDR